MIEAERFLEQSMQRGLDWYAGVPCSFLTGLVRRAQGDPRLTYVSAANEGDAVAAAAGAWLGGRRSVALMQNSGLGNAVNPLSSLLQAFRIPVLLLVTLRGEPGLADEPQHQRMGAATPRLLELLGISWEMLPDAPEELPEALARADSGLRGEQPYAFVVRKRCFAKPDPHPATRARAARARPAHACVQEHWRPGGARPTRMQALERVVGGTPGEQDVVIATTGHTGRELYALEDRDRHLYLVGSMGCASSFGLGLALARPDLRVVVIDGDGALLMRMGNLASVGAYAPPNLVHLLLDNEVHDSTGAQPTVADRIDFAAMAAACGYRQVFAGDELPLLDRALAVSADEGPIFAHLKIAPGASCALPRPAQPPDALLRRLAKHIGAPGPVPAAAGGGATP